LAAMTLAACSNFAPYETETPNMRPGFKPGVTAQELVTAAGGNPADAPVSVCYSRLASTPEQVAAVATSECRKGETAVLVDQGVDFTACSVLVPIRATFRCAGR
jgi:hypothetical protein